MSCTSICKAIPRNLQNVFEHTTIHSKKIQQNHGQNVQFQSCAPTVAGIRKNIECNKFKKNNFFHFSCASHSSYNQHIFLGSRVFERAIAASVLLAEKSTPAQTRFASNRVHANGDSIAKPAPQILHAPRIPASADEWAAGVVMLIDKPQDWTSFDVCGKLRGTLKPMCGRKFKVGHAGTLDPLATGLLIVCAGKATKQVDTFANMDKVYTGTLRLGQGTATYDSESTVEEELPWEHLSDQNITEAAHSFLGDIMQVPPIYSAIKVGGEALYKKARRGETVEIKSRAVSVTEFSTSREDAASPLVKFRVACTKGTYIRSLAFDLGKKLGTVAHLTELRRESIGEHSVQDAWGIQELSEAIRSQFKSEQAAQSTI